MSNKTFKLAGQVTISIYTEVQAKTKEEAIKIAEERDLCNISVSDYWSEKDVWRADELDGRPKNIQLYE